MGGGWGGGGAGIRALFPTIIHTPSRQLARKLIIGTSSLKREF